MSTELDPVVSTPPQRPASRREQVYLALRDELMNGRISPYERLAEERIAERHDVSRTPVREALARLQADGLVEKRDGGLYLYLPSFHELAGLYELRVTLELRGIERAIAEVDIHHDRTRLEAELDRWYGHRDHRPTPDAGFVAEDEQFHTTLVDASGNPALTQALVQVNSRIRSVRMYDYLTENRMTATITEHIEIAELVVRDRLPAALDALRHHVGASQDVVMERAANALAMTRMMT
ncbi:GntR family transcriptional regulator [Sanguibacter sp. Leaf3]|uniref:GntR family transcriptional regulator n=1 Tax=Sanguibacter sp. Leaf3 TaxID=1736209 RepID=UPI0006FA34EC|nr:GntR family transcriptional regulator [Sanguibacter sp. Leaf3]KQT98117.1 GntR family transcriptional regulator [Sanguibacter sp. Leaf3]